MVEFTKPVGNRIGLHLRAAGEFVKIAAQYTSDIRVYHGEKFANGKSILGLASLAAARGAQVRVEIEGPDETAAQKALEALFDAKFYED
jgi:phosphotransferase system HPr (HPr) family protein